MTLAVTSPNDKWSAIIYFFVYPFFSVIVKLLKNEYLNI